MFRLLLMVALYYPLSVGLTFYQKWFIKNYRLPLLIVAGHYATKYLLAIAIRKIVEWVQKNRRVRVPLQEQLRWLMPIGFCASLDIGLSNWSLAYVTVSLYTMAKSSSILFIVAFSLILKLERWSGRLGLSAFLIAFGLFLFTWQSTQLDLQGLLLVELAAFCTGIRWTISQLIMQGEECSTPLRHPLDMMVAVQPWMMVAIVPIVIVVEGPEMSFLQITSFHNEFQPGYVLMLVLIGGVLAFLMEFAEYLLLVNTSGITLSILGIVKEGISLLLAHHIHGDRLSNVNIAGLILCISGMVLHSFNKHRYSQSLQQTSVLSSPNNSRKESLTHSRSSPSPLVGRRNGKKGMIESDDRRKLFRVQTLTQPLWHSDCWSAKDQTGPALQKGQKCSRENCQNGRERRWMSMEEARRSIKQNQMAMLEHSIAVIEQNMSDSDSAKDYLLVNSSRDRTAELITSRNSCKSTAIMTKSASLE